MSAVLEMRDVSYRVSGRTLVDGASIAIMSGRLTVVVGPNGAGKSTLLRLLSGEIRPASGVVLCEGMPLALLPSRQLAQRRVVMTQASRLSFPFTVHEVVRLGLDGIGRGRAKADRERAIAESLGAAGVPALAARLYQTLSGGEQRRVQFARALAQLAAGERTGYSQALLLDEPIAGLDLRHQLALMDVAKVTAGRGVAVLTVLHELNLAIRYADQLILMDRGTIAACGPPSAILREDLTSQVFRVDLSVTEMPRLSVPLILPRRWLA